jgi:hypothetical protein
MEQEIRELVVGIKMDEGCEALLPIRTHKTDGAGGFDSMGVA